jgi:signal transduction histidine kinase
MSKPNAQRLAWSITFISIALVIIGLVLSILAQIANNGPSGPFPHQFFTPLLTVAYGIVGALVATHHPRNLIGWIFCATAFLTALNMLSTGFHLYDELALPSDSLPGGSFLYWFSVWIWIPNNLLPLTFLLLLFPDGHLLSTRWRAVAWAAGLGTAAITFSVAFHPGPLEDMGMPGPNPSGISGNAGVMNTLATVAAPLLLAGVLGSIASVIIRFRRTVGLERAQLKWLALAGVIVVVGNLLGSIPYAIWPDDPLSRELSIIVSDLTIAGIVVAAGIAMLRYRLWDIDIIISRALVYSSLTALIIGIYVVVVASLGALFPSGEDLPASLFASAMVAICFQPLRGRLQLGVNRLLYGDRDDPYAVLGRLAERLEVVIASQFVLPTIVETVAEALKLPYAAIALRDGEDFAIVAEYARSTSAVNGYAEILPLVYQSETIGQLMLAPRAPGESFSQNDRQLLETIARQAGIASYNVRLTQDLQRSRERLVTTREEERRRLRRDLHDGLGPALAAISFKLDASTNLVGHDPDGARALAAELKVQIQALLGDIRRIAYDLRPPALDELGLVGALREHVASYQAHELQITLRMPAMLPPLSAAVEVAAYHILLEAIHNVTRHARAHHCTVQLSFCDGLYLEVLDDGQGLPELVRRGVGMVSMRERAEELGGTCLIENRRTRGTRVLVRLPMVTSIQREEEGWMIESAS